MKIGTKVRYLRRNGEKVKGVVIKAPFELGRGMWQTIRVGTKGEAGAYEVNVRPSQLKEI